MHEIRHFFQILSIAAIALVAGCSGKETPRSVSEPRAPMVLLAIDGMEWHVMKPLLESGAMPVTASLMKRGTWGYLQSMIPTYSAVIWTSVATAKRPEKHGIEHFVYRDDNGEYRYYTSGHRKTKAFWNILTDYDLNVDCIGWWITYPAEVVNGCMVSQTNTTSVLHDPQRALWKGSLLKGVEDQVYPPEYQNHVMTLLEETDASMDALTRKIFGTLPNPPDDFGRLMWDQAIWALRADAVYLSVAEDLLNNGEPFDLLALYLGGPDVTGHRFWHYAYPDQFEFPPPKAQIENYGDVIDDYYVYVDRVIGEIVDAAPEGTTFIIASDHGMHAFNQDRDFKPADSPAETNSGHHLDAPPGVFIAAGPGIRDSGRGKAIHVDLDRMQTVGSVLDVMPTILALKGIPQGEDFDGKPLIRVLDDDWLGSAKIERIPTHDTGEWMATRASRIRQAIDESERLDQLRSLGYIR